VSEVDREIEGEGEREREREREGKIEHLCRQGIGDGLKVIVGEARCAKCVSAIRRRSEGCRNAAGMTYTPAAAKERHIVPHALAALARVM